MISKFSASELIPPLATAFIPNSKRWELFTLYYLHLYTTKQKPGEESHPKKWVQKPTISEKLCC